MAKAKKTKKEEVVELEPTGEVKLEQKKIENCEWCFQFDTDEPQVFAWTDEDLDNTEDPKVIFTINNIENSFISFTNSNSGKTFKIFARELSEQGKELRNKQREAFKTIIDASQNQETQS